MEKPVYCVSSLHAHTRVECMGVSCWVESWYKGCHPDYRVEQIWEEMVIEISRHRVEKCNDQHERGGSSCKTSPLHLLSDFICPRPELMLATACFPTYSPISHLYWLLIHNPPRTGWFCREDGASAKKMPS